MQAQIRKNQSLSKHSHLLWIWARIRFVPSGDHWQRAHVELLQYLHAAGVCSRSVQQASNERINKSV